MAPAAMCAAILPIVRVMRKKKQKPWAWRLEDCQHWTLELVLKAIQNVKEEQMVKTSCRGKVVVDLLSMLPQNGKNITDLYASLVRELETCFQDRTNIDFNFMGKLWSSCTIKHASPRRSELYGSHF